MERQSDSLYKIKTKINLFISLCIVFKLVEPNSYKVKKFGSDTEEINKQKELK